MPLPNRRALRYGPHGIHEYRGKFFPQLVRSFINIAGAAPGSVVLDPMMGSGTTAVEALLSDMTPLGLDMNPLSVLMARTKCELLGVDPGELADAYSSLRKQLLEGRPPCRGYIEALAPRDQEYLSAWFHEPYLVEIDSIATAIASRPDGPAKDLMWLALSNILRPISWQKTDDLRVRRDVDASTDHDVLQEFLEQLGRSVRVVLALRLQGHGADRGRGRIEHADARLCRDVFAEHRGHVDVVITSPPYATALPYLDTDRLSLIFLGLLPKSKHRAFDSLMIGNREVTNRQRDGLWARYLESGHVLPASVRSIIDEVHALNSADEGAGFRRKNLAALLAKYFQDMYEVLGGCFDLLKPGGHAFVVVGNNTTRAGHKRIEIGTAGLLADIAVSLSFEKLPDINMDMLAFRDIHRNNSMPTEQILRLRKPAS